MRDAEVATRVCTTLSYCSSDLFFRLTKYFEAFATIDDVVMAHNYRMSRHQVSEERHGYGHHKRKRRLQSNINKVRLTAPESLQADARCSSLAFNAMGAGGCAGGSRQRSTCETQGKRGRRRRRALLQLGAAVVIWNHQMVLKWPVRLPLLNF